MNEDGYLIQNFMPTCTGQGLLGAVHRTCGSSRGEIVGTIILIVGVTRNLGELRNFWVTSVRGYLCYPIVLGLHHQ